MRGGSGDGAEQSPPDGAMRKARGGARRARTAGRASEGAGGGSGRAGRGARPRGPGSCLVLWHRESAKGARRGGDKGTACHVHLQRPGRRAHGRSGRSEAGRRLTGLAKRLTGRAPGSRIPMGLVKTLGRDPAGRGPGRHRTDTGRSAPRAQQGATRPPKSPRVTGLPRRPESGSGLDTPCSGEGVAWAPQTQSQPPWFASEGPT